MAGARCTPPKSQSVKTHTRSKPRKRSKPRTLTTGYVVRDERTGVVVSRHRTFTAAAQARKRLDLKAYRQGKGRPYHVEKVG